ncbi:MAG: hypothetical protein WD995_05100 [Gemmatimonadota bacterium]
MNVDQEFRWPPPGLDRMQGDLWKIVVRLGLAGVFLVLPLLFVTTYPQDLATLGPFADAWWVTLVLATVGLAFAVDGFVGLARLLRRATHAVERGYGTRTVMKVVVDRSRDMGFLMRGIRHFSTLDQPAREVLITLRILTPALHAAAGLWLCLALAVGLVAAARDWIGPAELAIGTLAPAAVAALFGAITGLTEDARVRRARKAWHGRAWEDDLDPERVEAWEALARGSAQAPPEGASTSVARSLRRLALATSVAIAIVFFPILLLLPASAIGPTLARVSVPEYQGIQRRAAELEVYRAYGVAPDPSITPGEAGRLLQNLAYVGSDAPVPPGELDPPLRIEEPWLPNGNVPNPVGVPPAVWHDTLLEVVAADPSAEVRAYLGTIASHRAKADLSRLARAPQLDAASARWQDPPPVEIGSAALPSPRLFGLRAGAHAHVAAAAHELMQGRPAQAETLLRELISVGFLLADQGSTLMDNLLGHFMIREGGRALEQLFRVTGREVDAEELVDARASAERSAARIQLPSARSSEAIARMLPEVVLNPATVRGVAWESFALMATLAPCMNLNRVVFGTGEAYDDFVAAARVALVRWPSEEPIFRLAAEGFFGRAAGSGGFRPGRLLMLSVRTGDGACGDVIGRFRDIEDGT